MWQYHDEKMKELHKLYKRISKQTQNEIQSIFNGIDFTFDDLYSYTKNKKMIDAKIEEWDDKGLLNGDFGKLARKIKSRTKVKNNEVLELLIYGAYIEEQSKLQDKELEIIKSDVSYYYEQGQKEVNKKRKSLEIPMALFLMLLDRPIIRGYLWKEYLQATIKYNADLIYRQAVIDIQQQKQLKIDSDVYQTLITRQQKAKLNINENKISGSVDKGLITLNNQAKIEGITSVDENAKVKFIAVEDNRTTKMCRSLNGQIFNAHDWNKFERYSDTNKSIRKYRCYGLVTGLNLPPIDDHFHWCRSTIVYNTKYSSKDIEQMKHRRRLECIDITNHFKTSNKYKIEKLKYFKDDNNKYHYPDQNEKGPTKREEEVANLLGRIYGGKVEMVPRIGSEEGCSTPDYMINGIKFDLKEPTGGSKSTIYGTLADKEKQADNFVIDIAKSKLTDEDAINQVEEIYKSTHRLWVNQMVLIRKDKILKIYNRI